MNRIEIDPYKWTTRRYPPSTRAMVPGDEFTNQDHIKAKVGNTIKVTNGERRDFDTHYVFKPEKEDA